MYTYRARKNGLQNIFKKNPGRAKQTSQGTARRNFAKPRTSHFLGFCRTTSPFMFDLFELVSHGNDIMRPVRRCREERDGVKRPETALALTNEYRTPHSD